MDVQEIRDILGRNIKHFRLQQGLSQVTLAEKAAISVTFLSNIERGKMFPKVETLSRLTESLGVEVFELFKGDLVPTDSKELVNQLSENITNKINLAVLDVFKQYLG
jgi:transcriptional regulator with XRE-family HTH domain